MDIFVSCSAAGNLTRKNVTWRFLIPPGPMAAFKITTRRLNIDYILFDLFAQAYY